MNKFDLIGNILATIALIDLVILITVLIFIFIGYLIIDSIRYLQQRKVLKEDK